MNIRHATAADITAIRQLAISLFGIYLKAGELACPPWFANTLTEEQITHRIKSAELINRVALQGDHLAGYISMTVDGHLYHLFVTEKYHGNDIARLLWNDMVVLCDCSSYFVRASLNAVAVYKCFGFIEFGAVAEKSSPNAHVV